MKRVHYIGPALRLDRPCPDGDGDQTTEHIPKITCRRCFLNIICAPSNLSGHGAAALEWLLVRQDETIDTLRGEVQRLAGALAARDFDPRPLGSSAVNVARDLQVVHRAYENMNGPPIVLWGSITRLLTAIVDRLEGRS